MNDEHEYKDVGICRSMKHKTKKVIRLKFALPYILLVTEGLVWTCLHFHMEFCKNLFVDII